MLLLPPHLQATPGKGPLPCPTGQPLMLSGVWSLDIPVDIAVLVWGYCVQLYKFCIL